MIFARPGPIEDFLVVIQCLKIFSPVEVFLGLAHLPRRII